MSVPRCIVACISTALLIAAIVFAALNFSEFAAFLSGGSDAATVADEGAWQYIGIMLALTVSIIGLTLSLSRQETKAKEIAKIIATGASSSDKETGISSNHTETAKKLPGRTLAAAALIFLAIPLTIFVGSYYFGDRKYYFISLLIILETMLPFALVFERRKPQARELVVIAVLCAIAVAGRAAFFMLPQFKPVIALVIIASVAFGGETGFLVGAMTGFVSNFFFGQGPWTPYQMFAFGIIGFLSGVLFKKNLLRRSPAALSVFGALAALIVYGGIMNPAFIMIYQGAPTKAMLLAAYLQGIPMDLVHAAATALFLLIISNPMLEKLDRIKLKYGLIS